MGKSGRFWIRVNLSAVSFTAALGAWQTPARAQDAGSGLLGDAGAIRTALGKTGITLAINDSENLLDNTTGGVKQGATLQGVTTATLQVNTGTAFNLQSGTFNISALQIHGQSLSAPYLDNLQAANGNEAEDTTRLWELWYDQSFDQGLANIKIGQQSIDNEFLVSTYSGLFVNTMAGWPLIPSVDLYGGGPAYPLASLGARIQLKPSDSETLLAGVFDDNPGGGAFADDAQNRDAGGGKFNIKTGALFIGEWQYAINQPATGQMTQNPNETPGLPGTYKLGVWYDTGSFPDQRFGTDSLSLANPASNATPWNHRGNYSLYAVADQTIWQSTADTARSLNLFARIMAAPDTQNLVDLSINGGITLTAPLPGRDNDQAGIDFGLGKISNRAAGLDRDTAAFAGGPGPIRSTEELVELTYQAQVTPWANLQPDLQYIINPGAGIADPRDPTSRLRSELVAGARLVTTF